MELQGPQSLQKIPFDLACTTWINSPLEIPKCLAPFAHCLKEKDSLACEGELLEAQQQHCQPKVITFALQIIDRETEDAKSREMFSAEDHIFALLLLSILDFCL